MASIELFESHLREKDPVLRQRIGESVRLQSAHAARNGVEANALGEHEKTLRRAAGFRARGT